MIILPALGSSSANAPRPPTVFESPETSAESSSNLGDNNADQHIRDDSSISISHGNDDDQSTSTDDSGYTSDNKSRRSTDCEIVKRQQHIAYTRCAALFLVLAIAAAAGATTYVLTSQDHGEILQHEVRYMSKCVCVCELNDAGWVSVQKWRIYHEGF
jgi:hypothetical protein